MPATENSLSARDRILKAALQLFADRGFDASTTKAIAEEAGVPSGLIFYHFDTKQGLLRALMEGRSLLPKAREALEDSEGMEVRAILKRLGRTFFRATGEERCLIRILVHEMHRHDVVTEQFQTVADDLIELVTRQFDRAPTLPGKAGIAAEMFVYSIVFAGVFRPPEDPEAFIDGTLDVLLEET